ncbi:MAG: hypothetical protein U0903_19205 [Planctomycetales bacterium]
MSRQRFSVVAFVLVVFLCGPSVPTSAAPHYPEWWKYLPRADQNNVWYAQNKDSRTVFIFIHGVFSSSRSCWLYESPDKDPMKCAYWPQLLVEDAALHRPSIYLAGFYTKLNSGRYDMAQAAQELIESLKADRVLEGRREVIFVGHSTGGIMARYLLTHHSEQFTGKKIGLLLMASPSMGSKLANIGHIPAKFMDQQLGMQLEWNSPFLVQLDRDFRALLHDKRTLQIEGKEVIENKFVIESSLIPTRTVVVEEASGSRYFGPARMIGGSDHHSIVKPQSAEDPIHKVLVAFYLERFSPDGKKSQQQLEAQLLEADREIDRNPKDAFAYHKRGQACLGLERLQNALQALDRAIELYPHYFDALQERAIVHARLQQFDRAMTDINAAHDVLPDHPTPYVLRGMFRQSMAEQENDLVRKKELHEAALEDLSLGMRMQTNIGAIVHPLRAKSLQALGRTEEAQAELKSVN